MTSDDTPGTVDDHTPTSTPDLGQPDNLELLDEFDASGACGISDAEVQQMVDLDESLAQGVDIGQLPDASQGHRLARQLRCMQLLRQSSDRRNQQHVDQASTDRPQLKTTQLESAHRETTHPGKATLEPKATLDLFQQLVPALDAGSFPVQLGKFEIRAEIGRGGYGVVFLAYDRVMGRAVALKIPNTNVMLRDELLVRFKTESRAAGALDHPNIVQVFDAGHVGPIHYIASAYCPGISLHDWLSHVEGKIDQHQAATLIMTLARAIQHANERGVLHRDLKPANVLLQTPHAATDVTSTDVASTNIDREPQHAREQLLSRAISCSLTELTPKITDFGLAKLTAEEHTTASGSVLGTPAYMAPEQALGKSTVSTTRVDVYSLGAILYQLLTGRTPFEGDSAWEILRCVMHEVPTQVSVLRSSVARDLETICHKCIEKAPEQRYATAGQLADDLQRFLNREPIHARKATLVEQLWKLWQRKPLSVSLAMTLGVAVITSLITVSYLWTQSESRRIQVEVALADSRRASERAIEQQGRSERLLYLNRISLAEQEQSLNWAHALEELSLCNPKLRNWEWDYLWKQCHPALIEVAGHQQSARRCAFNHDGGLIASCSGTWGQPTPGEILVRDSRTGKVVAEWRGHVGHISGLAFHPTRNWLASSDCSWKTGVAGCTIVWDCDSGKQIAKLESTKDAFDLMYSPDGKHLAVGCNDGKVRIYRTADWQLDRTVDCIKRAIHEIAYHPDGTMLAAGGRDGRLCVIDLRSGNKVFEQDDLSDVRCVSFTGDGTLLVASTFSSHWLVWNVADWRLLTRHYSTDGRIVGLNPYASGGSLLVTTTDGPTRILDALSGEVACSLNQPYSGTSCAVAHPSGDLIATSGFDAKLRIWSTASRLEPERYTPLQSYAGDILAIPDRKWMAVAPISNTSHVGRGNGDFAIRLCDQETRTVAQKLEGHEGWVRKLDVSPDGQILISASDDGTVRVWNIDSATCQLVLSGHTGEVNSVALLSNMRAVSAGKDGKIKLWDLENGKCLGDLATNDMPWLALAASPASGWIAAADSAGLVRLWHVRTETPLERVTPFTCSGLTGPVNCLNFTDDGQQLSGGNNDYHIAFWNMPDDSLELPLSQSDVAPRLVCKLPDREVRDLQFLPDGERLAYASANYGLSSSLRLLDTITGEEALHLGQWEETALAVAYDGESRDILLAANSSVTWYSPTLPSINERWQSHSASNYDWHLAQADRAFQRQRWSNVVFHLTRCMDERPDAPEVATHTIRRCSALASLGRWEAAAEDLATYERLTDDPATLHFTKALFNLGRGDMAAFHLACDQMIVAMVESEDATQANDLAWTLALTPHRTDDLPLAVRLATKAIDEAKDEATRALAYNTQALVFYRQGDYERSLESALRAVELKKEGINEPDWAVLALLYAARGEREAANEHIDRINGSLERAVNLAQPKSKQYSRSWFNRYQIQLLLQEAKNRLATTGGD